MFGLTDFGGMLFGFINAERYTGPTWQIVCPEQTTWTLVVPDSNDTRECDDGA